MDYLRSPFSISVLGVLSPLDAAIRDQLLLSLMGLLSSETTDSEAAYRALVAVGNLVGHIPSPPRLLLNSCLLPRHTPRNNLADLSGPTWRPNSSPFFAPSPRHSLRTALGEFRLRYLSSLFSCNSFNCPTYIARTVMTNFRAC